MASTRHVDVSTVVDDQAMNPLLLTIMAVSCCILLFDAYDVASLSYAVPSLIKEWHVGTVAMGSVLSVGIAGLAFGSLITGVVADLLGRKLTIIAALCTFGLFTLLCSLVSSPGQLTVLRFLGSLGMGGLIPIVVSLNVEFAPRRHRVTVVMVMSLGFTLGTSLAGLVAAALLPGFGWRSIFVVGGVVPLLLAVLVAAVFPESIRFLTIKGRSPDRIARTIRRLRPAYELEPGTTFVVGDEEPKRGWRPQGLFAGPLAAITPVLWAAYILSSAGVFFMGSWLPTVSGAMGLGTRQAAITGTLAGLGGALGGLVLMRFVERLGAIAIAVFPLAASFAIAIWGMPGHSATFLVAGSFVLGLFVLGGHNGLNAVVGLFYPTELRATGVGWALSVAKIGSVCGPLIGGALLATRMPISQVLLVVAIPPLACALFLVVLGRLHWRLLRAERERAPVASVEVTGS